MVNISYKNLIQIHNKAMVDCSNKYKFDQCLNAILTKFYSNLGVYNTLYWQLNHYNEARIIVRSAIESVLLFSFLITHPDKIQEYDEESLLLEFKNSFIEMKELRTDLSNILLEKSQLEIYQEDYITYNKEMFKLLSVTKQEDILKILGIDEYILNDDTFNKLDKYLKDFRPEFQKFNKFFALKEDFPDLPIDLKEFLFGHYNIYSQITHGALYKSFDKTTTRDNLNDFSLFKRLLYTLIIICDYVKMPIDDSYKLLINDEINCLNFKIGSLEIIK